MKDIFKKITNSMIYSSILAIIFALFLIIFPGTSLVALGIIAGLFLIAEGIFMIFLDSKAIRFLIPFQGMLVGIVSIVMGILLLNRPENLSVVLTLALGIWIIVSSVNNIRLAYAMRNVKNSPWLPATVLAGIDLLIGITAILNPFEASLSIVTFLGIVILIHSIINIVDTMILKRDAKHLEKAVKETIKEAEIVKNK